MLVLTGLVEGSHRPRALPRRWQIVLLIVLMGLGAAGVFLCAVVLIAKGSGTVLLQVPTGPATVQPWSVVAAATIICAVSGSMTARCARARIAFVGDTLRMAAESGGLGDDLRQRLDLLLANGEWHLAREVVDAVGRPLGSRRTPRTDDEPYTVDPRVRANPTVVAAFVAATAALLIALLTTATCLVLLGHP